MAGSKAVDLSEVKFDPREITLAQFLDLYTDEGRKKGKKLAGWGNKIRNNKAFAKYLNEPVVKIFDVGNESEAGNLLADAQNLEEKTGGKSKLQSEIRNIEDNLFPRLNAISKKEKFDVGDFDTLSDKVQRLATRGNRVTNKFQYNPTKIGDLVLELQRHVKENPADKPIANAILLNLETASRPSLMTGLLFTDHVENQVSSEAQRLGVRGSDGLLIPPDRQGAKDSTQSKKPYNAPLSKRAVTIIQDQSEHNRTQRWSNRADPNQVFQILDGKDIRQIKSNDVTRVLKQLNVPGIIMEMGPDGGLIETTKKLTAQDLRKLGIQNMNLVGIGVENQAMLLSRDIPNVGGQNIYLGGAGTYANPAVEDINKHSSMMLGQFTQKLPGGVSAVDEGKVLAPKTFIFNETTEPTFEVYEQGAVSETPIVKPDVTQRTPVQTVKPTIQSKVTAEFATDPLSTVPPKDVEELKRLGLWDRFSKGLKAFGPVAGPVTILGAAGASSILRSEQAIAMPTEDEIGFDDLPRSTPAEAAIAGLEVAESLLSPLPMTAREMFEKREETEKLDTESGLRMSMPEPQGSGSFLDMKP